MSDGAEIDPAPGWPFTAAWEPHQVGQDGEWAIVCDGRAVLTVEGWPEAEQIARKLAADHNGSL